MLNRLGSAGLLLLIAEAIAPLAVSRDRCLSDLLSVTGRLPGSALVVIELVDLFESHVLGLVDEEINEDGRNPGETAPDPKHVGLSGVKSAGEIRSDERQEPVE